MTAVLLLAKLASLQGEWVAREDGREHAATFEVAAKNSAVVQKSGYLVVYSVDGDAVIATAWVDDGFSARYRAKGPKGLTEKLIVLDLVDLGNKAAAAGGSADRLEIELVDADHVVQRWRWRPKTGTAMTISVNLERKKP